jgi:hypothetical protein
MGPKRPKADIDAGTVATRYLPLGRREPGLRGDCGFKRGLLLPAVRPRKLLRQALSRVQRYVPRNTTRASTAFTPWPNGSTISGLMSNSAKCPSRCMARCDTRTRVSSSAARSAAGRPRKPSEIIRGAGRGPTAQLIKVDWRLTKRDGIYRISDVASIRNRRSGSRRNGEGHCFRPALRSDAAHRCCGLGEGLVPGETLPSRIGITFRTGATHRIEQAIGCLDEFGRGSTLGT